MMVVGDDGLIIIDPPMAVEAEEETLGRTLLTLNQSLRTSTRTSPLAPEGALKPK